MAVLALVPLLHTLLHLALQAQRNSSLLLIIHIRSSLSVITEKLLGYLVLLWSLSLKERRMVIW